MSHLGKFHDRRWRLEKAEFEGVLGAGVLLDFGLQVLNVRKIDVFLKDRQLPQVKHIFGQDCDLSVTSQSRFTLLEDAQVNVIVEDRGRVFLARWQPSKLEYRDLRTRAFRSTQHE